MTAIVYMLIVFIFTVGPLVLAWFDPAGLDPNHDLHHIFARR